MFASIVTSAAGALESYVLHRMLLSRLYTILLQSASFSSDPSPQSFRPLHLQTNLMCSSPFTHLTDSLTQLPLSHRNAPSAHSGQGSCEKWCKEGPCLECRRYLGCCSLAHRSHRRSPSPQRWIVHHTCRSAEPSLHL